MKRELRVTVDVRVASPDRGGGDVPGFLDMLRYDGARVLDWQRSDRGFLVTLASERITFDRWNSFGLYPKEVL